MPVTMEATPTQPPGEPLRECERLRGALIEMGRMIPGCVLSDEVSTDFLMLLPEEMRVWKAAALSATAPQQGEAGVTLAEREARVMQHWEWGNLTKLGVANMLRREGFSLEIACQKANALSPHLPQQVEATVIWPLRPDQRASLQAAAEFLDACAGSDIEVDGVAAISIVEDLQAHFMPENWDDCFHLEVARLLALAQSPAPDAQPIPMLLWCPKCHVQHVDEPDERTPDWDNPPHRSHLCHACGCIWRPADVATEGVRSIATMGKADNWNPTTFAGTGKPDATMLEKVARARAVAGFMGGHASVFRAFPNAELWGRPEEAEHAAGLCEEAGALLLAFAETLAALSHPQPIAADPAGLCAKDGRPCFVGRGTDDEHYRCGTSACRTPDETTRSDVGGGA